MEEGRLDQFMLGRQIYNQLMQMFGHHLGKNIVSPYLCNPAIQVPAEILELLQFWPLAYQQFKAMHNYSAAYTGRWFG